MSSSLPVPRGARSTVESVERVASLLGYEAPESGLEVVSSYPPCPTFYAPRVVEGPRNALDRARSGHMLLYLQGAALGVGVSQFLKDYAAVASARAPAGIFPVLRLALLSTAARPRVFLDALGGAVGLRLSRSSLSLRDASTIAEEIMVGVRMLGVEVLVVDHAEKLSPVGMEILAHLVSELARPRPTYRSSSGVHLSLVLASHVDPRRVLSTELASSLDLNPVPFDVYTGDDIAAVLPQVGLAEAESDASAEAAAELIEAIERETHGHVARMNRLFRCMLAVKPADMPVSAELIRYAGGITRGITELASRPVADRVWDWQPTKGYEVTIPMASASEKAAVPAAKLPSPPEPESLARVKKLREDRARAEAVRRQLTAQRPSRRRSP